jgi:hypothetical protein
VLRKVVRGQASDDPTANDEDVRRIRCCHSNPIQRWLTHLAMDRCWSTVNGDRTPSVAMGTLSRFGNKTHQQHVVIRYFIRCRVAGWAVVGLFKPLGQVVVSSVSATVKILARVMVAYMLIPSGHTIAKDVSQRTSPRILMPVIPTPRYPLRSGIALPPAPRPRPSHAPGIRPSMRTVPQ